MGIQRSNRHKRTKSGAKKGISHKKRKHALARPPSNTKIGENRVRPVRVRGGNIKQRALRLNTGTFKLGDVSANVKIMQVMYHPTNTELMRTNTLTKSSVVRIESDQLASATLRCDDPIASDLAQRNIIYGIVESRPGQTGNVEGSVLVGEELAFYMDRFKKGKANK